MSLYWGMGCGNTTFIYYNFCEIIILVYFYSLFLILAFTFSGKILGFNRALQIYFSSGTVNVKNGKSVATTKSVQTSSENAAFKPRTVLVKNASAVKVPISKPKSAKPVLVKTEVIGNLVTSGLVTADQPVRVKLEPSCAISTHKTTLPIAPKPLFPFANSMVCTPSHSAPNAEVSFQTDFTAYVLGLLGICCHK